MECYKIDQSCSGNLYVFSVEQPKKFTFRTLKCRYRLKFDFGTATPDRKIQCFCFSLLVECTVVLLVV